MHRSEYRLTPQVGTALKGANYFAPRRLMKVGETEGRSFPITLLLLIEK